jgi:hypothetical protein
MSILSILLSPGQDVTPSSIKAILDQPRS